MKNNRLFPAPARFCTGVTLVTACAALAACAPANEQALTAAPSTVTSTLPLPTSSNTAPTTTSVEPETMAAATSDTQPNDGATALGQMSREDTFVPPAAGTDLIPTGIRVGDHGSFTRVVLDFDGTGTPGWFSQLTTEPAQQASGLPVEYRGSEALVIGVEATPWPSTPELEAAFMDPGMYGEQASPLVTGVEYVNTFEAQSQYVIGLNGPVRYSISALDSPTRVVIDIAAE